MKKLIDFLQMKIKPWVSFGSGFFYLMKEFVKLYSNLAVQKHQFLILLKAPILKKLMKILLDLFKLSYSSDKDWYNLSTEKVETIFKLNKKN